MNESIRARVLGILASDMPHDLMADILIDVVARNLSPDVTSNLSPDTSKMDTKFEACEACETSNLRMFGSGSDSESFPGLTLQIQKASDLRSPRDRRSDGPGGTSDLSPDTSNLSPDTSNLSPDTSNLSPDVRLPQGFAEFWATPHLRRVQKQDAIDAWKKAVAKGAMPALEVVLSAARWQMAELFEADTPSLRYPHPATWLNGKRWENERPVPQAPPVNPKHLAQARTLESNHAQLRAIAEQMKAEGRAR